MYIKQISALQPGERLAKPIYTASGRILINARVELTAMMIRRLASLGIQRVYVSDPRTDDIVFEDSVSNETKIRATQMVSETFSDMLEARRWNRSISLAKLGMRFRGVFEDILFDLQGTKELLLQLTGIYTADKYLYTHSVNVGIYSAALGIALGLDRSQLLELGIGAMLHDIGMILLDSELLEKERRLTKEELEEIKQHTILGYEFLRQQTDIPLLSAHCSLQHHERIDGSGYPRGLRDKEIHTYGKIIGITDTYTALIAKRPYRNGYLPHEAMDILYGSLGKYDASMLQTFRNHIVLFPIGTIVSLSTGETGVVVDVNAKYPDRPIIRILKNGNGEDISSYEIDMSSHLSILISKCESAL
ncbi:HD-GYP domain-containing protein [Fodinisporobacter ferrooxydans]|uniref:HD-GYP domain-containing protein n=1 Tax=Fodinisporobacter ferrooxydans TaxID=2901836 RepID=A0ABY4CQ64_9BACL|nr:HD-GYP domain-containing protein [Alicyclobacillaceae bacterium MYW30-H2]